LPAELNSRLEHTEHPAVFKTQ